MVDKIAELWSMSLFIQMKYCLDLGTLFSAKHYKNKFLSHTDNIWHNNRVNFIQEKKSVRNGDYKFFLYQAKCD